MRRLLIVLAALLAAAVPAAVGIMGNSSFSQRLPVRSPVSLTTPDAQTRTPSSRPEPGDDKGGERTRGVSDDAPAHDTGDDKGGERTRGVSDDGPTHDIDDDKGGDDAGSHHSGSDDSGESGGHGSDD